MLLFKKISELMDKNLHLTLTLQILTIINLVYKLIKDQVLEEIKWLILLYMTASKRNLLLLNRNIKIYYSIQFKMLKTENKSWTLKNKKDHLKDYPNLKEMIIKDQSLFPVCLNGEISRLWKVLRKKMKIWKK